MVDFSAHQAPSFTKKYVFIRVVTVDSGNNSPLRQQSCIATNRNLITLFFSLKTLYYRLNSLVCWNIPVPKKNERYKACTFRNPASIWVNNRHSPIIQMHSWGKDFWSLLPMFCFVDSLVEFLLNWCYGFLPKTNLLNIHLSNYPPTEAYKSNLLSGGS